MKLLRDEGTKRFLEAHLARLLNSRRYEVRPQNLRIRHEHVQILLC
ncbi:hypothetical protein [Burkholderia territorii]|nr:hypothetical protein [Burkholderia territorii]